MKLVAKLVMIDDKKNYLIMYRNKHPYFGNDVDLPGGTLEKGEEPIDTMVREVYEEAGLTIDGSDATLIHTGSEYSPFGTDYVLYEMQFEHRPDITISWEHAEYEWLDKKLFLEKAKDSKDPFMHMVHDTISAI